MVKHKTGRALWFDDCRCFMWLTGRKIATSCFHVSVLGRLGRHIGVAQPFEDYDYSHVNQFVIPYLLLPEALNAPYPPALASPNSTAKINPRSNMPAALRPWSAVTVTKSVALRLGKRHSARRFHPKTIPGNKQLSSDISPASSRSVSCLTTLALARCDPDSRAFCATETPPPTCSFCNGKTTVASTSPSLRGRFTLCLPLW